MKLADDQCHRVLAYVAALQQQGVQLTAGNVNAYAKRTQRKKTSTLPDVERLMFFGMGQKVRETPLVWLYRVHWIDLKGPSERFEDSDIVSITPVGRGALRALDEAAAEKQSSTTAVALDGDDPTALAKVIEQIMSMGTCALVDRYFSQDVFLAAAQRTKIERILTGPNPEKRLAGLGQALADVNIDRDFEIRVDEEDQHHDRFVIPDDGPVWALGASMNGVGARHSVMTEIKGPPAEAIRARFEETWSAAQQLEPASQHSDPPVAEKHREEEPGPDAEPQDAGKN